jgi:hypothetical protein
MTKTVRLVRTRPITTAYMVVWALGCLVGAVFQAGITT